MDFLYLQMFTILAQQATGGGVPGWLVFVGALLSSGAITALLNYMFNKRKTSSEVEKIDADAADIIQRAAGELIVKIQEDAARSQEQIHRENKVLQLQNDQLLEEIRALRIESTQLRAQVSRIPELEVMIRELQDGVEVLIQQLEDNGINPVFTPSQWQELSKSE